MSAPTTEGPVAVEQGSTASVNEAGNDVIYEPAPVVTPCKEHVVLTGMSCRLPQSENMQEFRNNLMNGVDMVTEDESRWKRGNVQSISACVVCRLQ